MLQNNLLGIAAIAVAGALGLGCSTADQQPAPPDDSVITEDSLRMVRETLKDRRTSMNLDMGNAAHYRFVKHRLAKAGLTTLNSPQLFSVIEADRLTPGAPAGSAARIEACDHAVLPEAFNEGSTDPDDPFQSTAIATCSGGALYTYVDSILYEFPIIDFDNISTLTPISPQKAEIQFGRRSIRFDEYGEAILDRNGGKGVEAATVGYVSGPDMAVLGDSLAIQLEEGEDGTDSVIYTYTQQVSVSGADLLMQDPVDTKGTPGNCDEPDGIIRTCLERSSEDHCDCDYFLEVDHWGEILLPMKGFMTYVDGEPIDITQGAGGIHEVYTQAFITLAEENGGECELQAQNFDENILIGGPELKTATWNFTADFGDACFLSEERVIMGMCVFAHTADNRLAGACERPKNHMTFRYGCLAEGTEITLADGSRQAIDTIFPETVSTEAIIDGEGHSLPIIDRTVGYERVPMFLLEDSLGHSLLLTAGHPVMTVKHGLIRADELQTGDLIKTEDGVAALTGIKREKYERRVWNLRLGDAQDHERVGVTTPTMYANGIMVGDETSQNLIKRRRASYAEIPERWRKDLEGQQSLLAKLP